VGLLLAIALILLLFGVVGGVAISKFLFLVLIVAAVLALVGFMSRTA
jgi:multisubunit Na+/H+ antiporter MnhF subunit